MAQEASVSTGTEHTAQKGPGQTTQSGAEKFAASLPKVLLCIGETKHSQTWLCFVLHCSTLSLQKDTVPDLLSFAIGEVWTESCNAFITLFI